MPATASGTVSYNGITFSAGSRKMQVSMEAVFDDANRVHIANKHTITLTSVVANSALATGTTGELFEIQRKLMQRGAPLIVNGTGCYNLAVNTGDDVRDVMFGPLPEVLSWHPIGDKNAAEVTFRVTTHLPACYAPHRWKGVMALNYTQSYSLNDEGLMSASISGYLQIAVTIATTQTQQPDSADNYRDLIASFLNSSGWRVDSQNYTLSSDGARLDFSIALSEFDSPNSPPKDVVKIRANHTVEWARGDASRFRASMSAAITRRRGADPTIGYLTFGSLVASRIKANNADTSQYALLERLRISEDLYGYTDTFDASWRYTAPLREIVSMSGLWFPLPAEFNWGDWAESMRDSGVWKPRGFTTFVCGAPVVVSLCTEGNGLQPEENDEEEPEEPEEPEEQPTLSNGIPPEEVSWLEYEQSVAVRRNRPVVRQAVLQAPDEDVISPSTAPAAAYPDASGISDIIQTGGRSRYTVIYTGHAKRAGHKIPRPALFTYGNKTVTEVDGHFQHASTANMLGVPIYQAAWHITYVINNSPGVIYPPGNPMEDINDNGDIGAPPPPGFI